MQATLVSGLAEFLEGKPGVRDVQVVANKPVTLGEVSTWEKGTGCVLPQDLKQFYLTHNGLTLTWGYQDNGGVTTLGRIGVSALSSLQHLHPSPPTHPPSTSHPSLLDLDYGLSLGAEETGGSGEWRPGFGRHCKAFPLDYCPSCGHSCLVYNTSVDGSSVFHGVWLLDLSLQWHRLSDSFSDYLRQAVVHLGLRQWPYALTTNRISPQFERWFHVFIPTRLQLDHTLPSPPSATLTSPPSTTLPSPPSTSLPGPSHKGSPSRADTSSQSSTPTTTFVNSLDIAHLLQNVKSTRDRRARESKRTQTSGAKKAAGSLPYR